MIKSWRRRGWVGCLRYWSCLQRLNPNDLGCTPGSVQVLVREVHWLVYWYLFQKLLRRFFFPYRFSELFHVSTWHMRSGCQWLWNCAVGSSRVMLVKTATGVLIVETWLGPTFGTSWVFQALYIELPKYVYVLHSVAMKWLWPNYFYKRFGRFTICLWNVINIIFLRLCQQSHLPCCSCEQKTIYFLDELCVCFLPLAGTLDVCLAPASVAWKVRFSIRNRKNHTAGHSNTPFITCQTERFLRPNL